MTYDPFRDHSIDRAQPPGPLVLTRKESGDCRPYRERLHTIAEAIALKAQSARDWRWDPTSLAAATLVVWYSESRFALKVHNGSGTSRYREDEGRARCFGKSIRPDWCRSQVEEPDGNRSRSYTRCARATIAS